MRASITPAERLALTIIYLATGNSQESLSFNYCIGRSTVCGIVWETSMAIWGALQPLYVKAPATECEWRGVSTQFEHIWNFPHCACAIDGKHAVIQAPANAGYMFYNYKGSHSIVHMAVCDGHYCFILDIGDVGRHSNGGVISNSDFGRALNDGRFQFPVGCPLPGTSQPDMPFAIVCDEAFPSCCDHTRGKAWEKNSQSWITDLAGRKEW